MTLATSKNKEIYVGNGSATIWPITFRYLDEDHLKIYLTAPSGAPVLLSSDYYIDNENSRVLYPGYAPGAAPDPSEQPPVLPNGWKITILREVPLIQETDLTIGGGFRPGVLEDAYDYGMMASQQLLEALNRSVRLPVDASPGSSDEVLSDIMNYVKDAESSAADALESANAAADSEDMAAQIAAAVGATVTGNYLSTLKLADLITKGPWVDVRAFGAKGDGVTDDTAAIQAAIDYVAANKKYHVFIPSGTYMINDTLLHATGDKLATRPINGVKIIGSGASNTTIKALPTFPANKPMIYFDGNKENYTTTNNAVAQNYDYLSDITLDGSNVADRGLQLRGVAYSQFKNVFVIDIDGVDTDAAVYVKGVTASKTDDTDTTYACVFDNLRIDTCGGHGFLATNNRTASILMTNCDIRNTQYDGMRVSFAGLILQKTTFASNGRVGVGGGFVATKAQTGAINRGLQIVGCEFEANWDYEINIDWCYGFNINGGLITPYVRAASGQCGIKLGAGTGLSSVADGGTIYGQRFASYSTVGPIITGIVLGEYASNIDIKNNSFDLVSPDNWYVIANRYAIHEHAAFITIDGNNASRFSNEIEFAAYATTNANAVANITGDGTEYYTSVHALAAGTPVLSNNGVFNTQTSHSGSIASETLTVTAGYSGAEIDVGSLVRGANILPNTFVIGRGSGAGAAGTYLINKPQTVALGNLSIINRQSYSQKTGIFTAPVAGTYEFEVYWPLTGFGGSETDIEVAIVKNHTGTPERFLCHKSRPDAALNAAAINCYGGKRVVTLLAGDTVVGSVKVSGGTKIVDFYRATDLFRFSGRKL